MWSGEVCLEITSVLDDVSCNDTLVLCLSGRQAIKLAGQLVAIAKGQESLS